MHVEIIEIQQVLSLQGDNKTRNVLVLALPNGASLEIGASDEVVEEIVRAAAGGAPGPVASKMSSADEPQIVDEPQESEIVDWTQIPDEHLPVPVKNELERRGAAHELPVRVLLDLVGNITATPGEVPVGHVEQGVALPRRAPAPRRIESDEVGNPIVSERRHLQQDVAGQVDDDTGVASI